MNEALPELPDPKEVAAQEMIRNLWAGMASLGINTCIVAVPLSTDPEGCGLAKMWGNPTLLLNLLSALIKSLTAEDFHSLLIAMQHSEFFAASRQGKDAHPEPQAPEQGKKFLN